jgi:glycosyltransferase involved in cell wall biosynthesis
MTPLPLKICYPMPSYRSHRRVAESFQALLRRSCEMIPSSDYAQADVIALHYEPDEFDRVYASYPALARIYVVGINVWEASELPEEYIRAIPRVQEIWTGSQFCVEAYRKHHPNVHYVPHVVERDMTCSPADLDAMKRRIGHEPGKIYFGMLARKWGGHKNARALVHAFERQRPHMPDARLVIKVDPGEPRTFDDPRIIWLTDTLTDAEINAFYRLIDVYVSPHYGEGWGLTLSDAMLFGKPVIATGYSGNLEFMNDRNSWLLGCEETEIREGDQYALYARPMHWAYPDQADLEAKLRELYETLGSDAVAARVARASEEIRRFDRSSVEPIIRSRLEQIASHLQSRQRQSLTLDHSHDRGRAVSHGRHG